MVTKKNINKTILENIRHYVKHINTEGYPINKVIIFGSWAKGSQKVTSDIDLCLVSSKFGSDEIAELQYLLKQTRLFDDRIEPVPVSTADFSQNVNPLVVEIKKYGVTIDI